MLQTEPPKLELVKTSVFATDGIFGEHGGSHIPTLTSVFVRGGLEFLLDLLELDRDDVGGIGYQLLHRTASAILEARRFGAHHAVMLVHSFSQELEHFDDYTAFVGLFGEMATPNKLIEVRQLGDVTLYLGWAVGNAEYLTR